MTLISLVVALVIVGVAVYLLTLIPMDPTIRKVIHVVIILAVILYVLSGFGLISGFNFPLR